MPICDGRLKTTAGVLLGFLPWPLSCSYFASVSQSEGELAAHRRSHLADNDVLPHQLSVTQTQKVGMRGRLCICHHFTICHVLRVSLGDQQGLVGSEEEISTSKQAAVLVLLCCNQRDVIRQQRYF